MRRATYQMIVGATAVLTVTAAGCREVAAPDSARCADPAPLLGQFDPTAPGFIVVYRDGVDAAAETSRLAGKYDFTPTSVYTSALHGFAARLPSAAVAGVRCERSVAYVEHDASAWLAAPRAR